MSKYPLVSVAVITYNQKEFLIQCLNSIIEQDYPNFEIIVADDGSTDGTREVLLEYSKNYPKKLKLILSECNEGITANSNKAHFASTGKYIAWIGGDDLMMPGKLTQQVEYMENNPLCAISYHDMVILKDNKEKGLYSKLIKPREGGKSQIIKYGTFNCASSTMVKRDLTPNGYNSCLFTASDWLYWFETLKGEFTINYINDVLGKYRKHESNVSRVSHGQISQGMVDTLNTCNYMLQQSPDELKNILKRYSQLLFSCRHFNNYISFVRSSIRISFSIKNLLALVVYYLSLSKIRL